MAPLVLLLLISGVPHFEGGSGVVISSDRETYRQTRDQDMLDAVATAVRRDQARRDAAAVIIGLREKSPRCRRESGK